MPIIDDNSYSLSGTLNKGALCKHPCTSVMFQEESPLEAVYNMICWLLERHFDFRDLIPMGLALEAPEDMYK